jgi:hypothetical protein
MIRVLGPLLIEDGERTLGARDLGGVMTEISLHALAIGDATRILGLVQDRSEHRQPTAW